MAFQAVIPLLIFVGTFFIRTSSVLQIAAASDNTNHAEALSPRWLITKGRKEEAVEVLNKVRPKEDVESGATRMEVEAIHEYLQNVEKAPWPELFVSTSPSPGSLETGNYLPLRLAAHLFHDREAQTCEGP